MFEMNSEVLTFMIVLALAWMFFGSREIQKRDKDGEKKTDPDKS